MIKNTAKISWAILLSILVAKPSLADPASLCDTLPEALHVAAEIRGLKPKSRVACQVQNKAQVKEFILSQVDTKIPALRLTMEEGVFKVLGLIPLDYDYKKGILELYTDQIGGYYDPATKRYTMANWMPPSTQQTVAVHELTHALQDQYFDIGRFQEVTKLSTDEQLAASCLVEGDATAVMLDAKLPKPGLQALENVDAIVAAQAMGAAFMIQGREGVPESLKMLLIFPYSEGLRFAHSLLRKNSYRSVDEAFKSPPKTTHEIFNPGVYVKGFNAVKLKALQCQQTDPSCKTVHEDSLGELMLRTALTAHNIPAFSAQRLASAWRGDKLQVDEVNAGHRVIWQIACSSQESAGELLTAMMKNNFSGSISRTGNTIILTAPFPAKL